VLLYGADFDAKPAMIGKGMNKAILSLLAQGDAIISATCLRSIGKLNCVQLITGRHNAAVLTALSNRLQITVIDISDPIAIFNLRKEGLLRSIFGVFELRDTITKSLESCTKLIVEKPSIRWRFIIPFAHNIAEPKHKMANVYMDRTNLFRYELSDMIDSNKQDSDWSFECANNLNDSGIVFCPTARHRNKQIPLEIMHRSVREIRKQGLKVTLVDWCGQYQDVRDQFDVYKNNLDKKELFTLIKSALGVISADSMAGHAAEFYGKPVYIVFNEPNIYWAPLSAFNNSFYFITEDKRSDFSGSLEEFMSSIL
jgi:hypothetical protein